MKNAVFRGIWAGECGESAEFWLRVLTEIKNRGGEDESDPKWGDRDPTITIAFEDRIS